MKIDPERIRQELEKIRRVADQGGYRLNPDQEFVQSLVEGILINRERYGYDACPCRLATGDAAKDRAIVCPCTYRDADLAEYDACYCALYVTDEYDEEEADPVPDRWNAGEGSDALPEPEAHRGSIGDATSVKAHVCEVCGYTAMLQDHPPRRCPTCGVGPDRFRELRVLVADAALDPFHGS